MNIAVWQPYGETYEKDKLFNLNSCNIGQNLLLPGIKLKEELEKFGHNYHTIDCYKFNEIDKIVFFEIPGNSFFTITGVLNYIKYFLKLKFNKDYLLKAAIKKIKVLLVIQEPYVVMPLSYNVKYHIMFDKILTWDDRLVDGKKYFKYYYPQVKPNKNIVSLKYNDKKLLTMMCSNKTSNQEGELYSKRYELIRYFEKNEIDFDLYGYGWESEKINNYRGIVNDKLATLSKYKFSICFENMTNIDGYITEKIFDCFFANCIPIYWGANNINKHVPDNTFIDYRMFASKEELLNYIINLSENEYNNYLKNIQEYLNSDLFYNKFSIDAYINTMTRFILD